MIDRRAQFDRLQNEIDADHQTKMEALFIIFPEFSGDIKANPLVRRAEKVKKEKITVPATKHGADPETKLCEISGCGTRLRKDYAKKCESCGTTVCKTHWNKSNDSCVACAER